MTARTAGVALVLATSSIYYAVLAFALSPPAAFWSGDAGVKLVQLESLLRQDFTTVALEYPGAEFDPEGAFWPFPPPYGVERGGCFYSTFPPYFSIATVPFYKAFGLAGLRVLPCLGGVGILIAGWLLLRQLRLSPLAELMGLVLLAFGSPIAFYSATFWEHTPATALCIAGLALAGGVLARDGASPTWKLLLAGAGCGLAFALRMEALFFAGVVGGAILWARGAKSRSIVAVSCFTAGVAVPAGCVVGLNLWRFGHPLGLFEPHFLENPSGRFEIIWELLVDLNPSLWGSDGLLPLFPVVVLGLVPLVWPKRFSRLARFHALVGVAFVAAMLVVAPNAGGKQFGPRYLLLGLPPLFVAAATTLPSAITSPWRSKGARRVAWLLFLVLGALSMARGFQGSWRLWEEKNGIEGPMLRVASGSPARIIVASHPYFPQQAAGLYFEKTILRLPLQAGYVPDLSEAGFLFEAAERGVEQVLYVDDFRFPRVRSFSLVGSNGTRLRIEVGEPTVVGHYRFQPWRLRSR